MNTRRVIVPIISTVVFAASCLAAEPFQIPGERDRAVVGTWIMVLMGEGEDLKAVPVEKATEFILRADGSGTLREGLKEKAILRIAEIAEGPRGQGAKGPRGRGGWPQLLLNCNGLHQISPQNGLLASENGSENNG